MSVIVVVIMVMIMLVLRMVRVDFLDGGRHLCANANVVSACRYIQDGKQQSIAIAVFTEGRNASGVMRACKDANTCSPLLFWCRGRVEEAARCRERWRRADVGNPNPD